MEQIGAFFSSITAEKIIDIWIAIAIVVLFRIFSGGLSYIIIKMCKIKEKKPKRIKESVLYNPLKAFFVLLGLYIAIIFLRKPLDISTDVMMVVYRAFVILSTIIFAKGLASSFTPKSSLYTKIKIKTSRNNKEDSMLDFSLKIIRIVIYVLAGIIIITNLGINLNGIITGLGIGGVIVTLAAQDTAKNLFGGLVIFLDKPFVVGDWIQMDDFEGTVEDITFRSTRVRTFENSVVNIPNSVISNSSIINWSKMERRRYKTNLCVELNTPLEKLENFKVRVHEMLKEKSAIYDDTIIVKFDEIKDNGLNVMICSYTDSVDYPSYLAEKQDINYKIMKILEEEGIELAYDTKTVYVKN